MVHATDGRVVWDLESYAFLDAECPDTANPSLWRQSQLNAIHGLFEVTAGIYQVRGLDLSNMTIVEGQRGVIVIDPLISTETAAAALALYRSRRGDRPVTGVIYTHSHVDHFGGVKGVVDPGEVAAGNVPVLAPDGFLHHAVSENVYAGTAMARRAVFMYGALLEKGPAGQIGAGLGQTTSTGTVTLIAPTLDIVETGQEETIDGVRIVFQVTPGTEAPAEMNFFFPDHGAFCAGRERDAQPAQHPDPARRGRARRATCGRATSTRRSTSTAPTSTCSSPSTTGPGGVASASASSSASSGMCTATSTTRPCGS